MFSSEKKLELLEAVRRELVRDPSASIYEIQDALNERYEHVFDKNFVAKLKNKVHRERARRTSNSIEFELARLEDTCIALRQRLWEIVDDEATPPHVVVSAMREIRSVSHTLLEAMFNAGVFERQLGIIKGEGKLSDEDQVLLERAMNHVRGRVGQESVDLQVTSNTAE